MSGSLLLIAAVWLVLLAPLLLRNQKPVRRTAQALSETRVLHRGGSELNAKRKLKPAKGLYMISDDEELELVDAEPEYVLLEDEDSNANKNKGASRGLRDLMTSKSSADEEAEKAAEVIDGEVVETIDDDVEDTGDVAEKVVSSDVKAPSATANVSGAAVRYTAQDEMDTGEFSPVKKAEMSGEADAEGADSAAFGANSDSTGGAEVAEENAEEGAAEDNEEGAQEDTQEDTQENTEENTARQAAYAAVPTQYVRGGDVKASPGLVDEVDAAPASKAVDILEDSDELSEADLKYLAARRGRGVYDPVASAELARQRQNRRKRVLLVLLALCALTFGTSLALGGAVWLTFIAMVAFTAFYLVMLRRQAVEERELRHRRLARMRRARLGVRNTEDDELGVPDRLMRPGAVILETDDNDPALSNLEYADGADFFDMPGTETHVGPGVNSNTNFTNPRIADRDEEYLDPRSGIRAV